MPNRLSTKLHRLSTKGAKRKEQTANQQKSPGQDTRELAKPSYCNLFNRLYWDRHSRMRSRRPTAVRVCVCDDFGEWRF